MHRWCNYLSISGGNSSDNEDSESSDGCELSSNSDDTDIQSESGDMVEDLGQDRSVLNIPGILRYKTLNEIIPALGISKGSILVNVIAYSLRHSLSYKATDLLYFLNCILGTSILPSSKFI